LAERGSLGIRELQPPFQLGLHDPIFGGQIFVPRQQLLVHHPRDKGQDARPIHSSSTPADSRLIAPNNCSQRHPAGLRREWTTHRLFYSLNFFDHTGEIDVLIAGGDTEDKGRAKILGKAAARKSRAGAEDRIVETDSEHPPVSSPGTLWRLG